MTPPVKSEIPVPESGTAHRILLNIRIQIYHDYGWAGIAEDTPLIAIQEIRDLLPQSEFRRLPLPAGGGVSIVAYTPIFGRLSARATSGPC